MKKNYLLLRVLSLNLALLLGGNAIYASNVPSTAGAASSSTSGIYQPANKVKLPIIQKSGVDHLTPVPPVCVDSGAQGRRCGITAITFCKINPDALNCNTINNQTSKK